MKILDIDKISYTQNLSSAYSIQIDHADTLPKLLNMLKYWEPLAWDALDIVKKWKKPTFEKFKKFHAEERERFKEKRETTSEEIERLAKNKDFRDFLLVLMPDVLMRIGLCAAHFMAPEGCAFIRMREIGSAKTAKGKPYEFIKKGVRVGFGSCAPV